jgi:hypothetical protein
MWGEESQILGFMIIQKTVGNLIYEKKIRLIVKGFYTTLGPFFFECLTEK